jgi:hypothetical protein
MNARDIRQACHAIRTGECSTAADVQRQYFQHVGESTMRRTLAKNGLPGRRKRKVPVLTDDQRLSRLAWGKKTLEDWEGRDFESVVYSDESPFKLYGSDGILYCRRGVNEDLKVQNVQQKLKHGGGKVMVWGCITSRGFGRLVRVDGIMNAEKYCQILEEGLLGTLRDYNIAAESIWFQQDNDPKHTSHRAEDWFKSHSIDVLPWPSNSPDMNIIENVWWELERRYNRRPRHARNIDELFAMLQQEWNNMSKGYLDKL